MIMRKIKCLFQLGILITCTLSHSQDFQRVVKPDSSKWYFAHMQLPGNYIDTIYADDNQYLYFENQI